MAKFVKNISRKNMPPTAGDTFANNVDYLLIKIFIFPLPFKYGRNVG